MSQRRPPVRSRWRTGLEVVAALAVLAGLAAAAPEPGGEPRYAYDDVAIGEVGRLREFDATIDGVRLVGSISRNDDVLRTEHAFVVVALAAEVRTEGQNLQNVELRTADGVAYAPRPEWFGAGPTTTQPGFTNRVIQVFEVPRAGLAGAVLVVGPDQGETSSLDRAVRVPLGVDAATPVGPGPIQLPAATTEVTR